MTKKQAILELLDAYVAEAEGCFEEHYSRDAQRSYNFNDINKRNYKWRVLDYHIEWKEGRKTATECINALMW